MQEKRIFLDLQNHVQEQIRKYELQAFLLKLKKTESVAKRCSEEHLLRSPVLERTPWLMFSCEIYGVNFEISLNMFFVEHFWVTASGRRLSEIIKLI